MSKMPEIPKEQTESKRLELVIKETEDGILLESTNTYDKNGVNGYRTVSFPDKLFEVSKITTDMSKITCLNLSSCQLTNVPDFLSDLWLKSLNLSHNCLKLIPDCVLNGLEHVENLNLSCNRLKEFESEPKCAMQLRVLNLESNQLTFIPIWILRARSISLREFYYSYNQIGNTDDTKYGRVTLYNLRKLHLKNSSISSRNMQFLKSIRNLTDLNLSNDMCLYSNNFIDYEELFSNAAWSRSVEVLNLNNLVISFVPKSICAVVNLRELYLSDNRLFGLPNFVTHFAQLEVLDLSKNSISSLPDDLKCLCKLRALHLQYNSIGAVPDISGLMKLKVLDLYGNYLENFPYDLENFHWIDLEQNVLTTSVFGVEYTSKRDSFRLDNKIDNRLIGCREEADSFGDSEESSESSLEDDSIPEDTSGNFVVSAVEEELWDAPKVKSHPDITTSDDEWQGYFVIARKKKAVPPRPKKNLDYLFDDAD